MASLIIPFPTDLRPRLPTIVGNVDYLTLCQRLEQIDSLLQKGGLEADFVEQALQGWRKPKLAFRLATARHLGQNLPMAPPPGGRGGPVGATWSGQSKVASRWSR